MIQDIDTIQSQMLAGKLTEAKKTNTSDEEALMEACEGFEAIFTKTMLDSMRATLPGDALFPETNGQEIMESMKDQQLADDLSKAPHGTGIKEFLYNQLKSSL